MKSENLCRAFLTIIFIGLSLGCREQKLVEETGKRKPPVEEKDQADKDPFSEFRISDTVEDALDEALNHDGFLVSDYNPLQDWFDERFEVRYRNMAPELIFDQVPLNDLYYDLTDLPKWNGKAFDFSSANVSRRELLKKIASFWDLKMSINVGEDGTPSAIKVSGK